jgi:uncharacterized membrane protein
MRTPASIKAHPIHPILVTFPIALWVFSLAADIIRFANWGPPDVWREVAFYSMAAGIAGALLAALPGFIDLFSLTDPRLRRIGIIHMVMNLIIVALFAINWSLRFTRADSIAPMGLSVIGVFMLFISGWLGADLVHEYRVSVEEPGSTPPARL